jgi:hypothetical protein
MNRNIGVDQNQEAIKKIGEAAKAREPKFEELEKARRDATEQVRKGDA